MKTLNETEALEKLQKCVDNSDIEISHCMADKILCSFLMTLGYEKIVNKYNDVEKWYALDTESEYENKSRIEVAEKELLK